MKAIQMHLITLLAPCFLCAQKINTAASFRDMENDSYFRISLDNDFFTSTDQNYTGGYNIELVRPIFINNPVNVVLLKPSNCEIKYGLALEQIDYTPSNIGSHEIQYGDRPFAAAIMLKCFTIATNSAKKSRYASTLSAGIIGPGATGKEMQVFIHKATGNTHPNGWCNQIKNDLVINYELGYERRLFGYRDLIALHSDVGLRFGTLFTNFSAGFNAVAGLANSPYSDSKRKFVSYLYIQPLVNAIAYDATLQGGLFSNGFTYAVSGNEIARFTAQCNYGIVLRTSRFYFEYSQTIITREFKSGLPARWGGLKFGYKI